MKEKIGVSKKFIYILFFICIILLIFIIVGFTLFANRKEKVITEEENGGSVVLKYTNEFAGLKLLNAIPTSDISGINNCSDDSFFDFSVEVSIDEAPSIDYEISLVKEKNSCNVPDEDIRIYLEKEKSGTYTKVFGPSEFTPLKKNTELNSKMGSMVIYSINKMKTSVDNYRLKIWLSDKSLVVNNSCNIEVFVNGKAK